MRGRSSNRAEALARLNFCRRALVHRDGENIRGLEVARDLLRPVGATVDPSADRPHTATGGMDTGRVF